MNKTDLIQRLADTHELSKAEAGRILETLLDTIVTSVKKGDAVTIPGFGSFKQHARAARAELLPFATGRFARDSARGREHAADSIHPHHKEQVRHRSETLETHDGPLLRI
mgnify:CR=1 FL=1